MKRAAALAALFAGFLSLAAIAALIGTALIRWWAGRAILPDRIAHPTVLLAGAGIALAALAFLLLPLALAESRAQRRFDALAAALAEPAPHLVAAYDGPEGRGVIRNDPDGRVLLLHAMGGVGWPTIVLPDGTQTEARGPSDLPPLRAPPIHPDAPAAPTADT